LFECGQKGAGHAASTDSNNDHGTLSAAPNQAPYGGTILGRRLVPRVYSCPILSMNDGLPHGVVRQRTINKQISRGESLHSAYHELGERAVATRGEY
jgi:hypothetical protein